MKRNLRKTISTVMAVSLVLSSANADTYAYAAKKVSITKTAKVTAGKSTVVKLKNNKKKVTWKVTKGTKYVKITKKSKTKCTVKGIKKGKATVQATVGKKKYKCTITVAAAKKAATTKKPSTTKTPSATETPKSITEPSDIKTVIYDGTNSSSIKDIKGKPFKVVVKEGVTSIEIPNSVKSIEGNIFDYSDNSKSIIWKGKVYLSQEEFVKAFYSAKPAYQGCYIN